MATRKQGKSLTRKTTKPTGGTLSRSAKKFTLKWKIGDKDYKDGVQARVKLGKGKWSKAIKLGAKTTAYSVTINVDNYYPKKAKGSKLTSVRIKVRGKRAKYKENYTEKKNPFWRWVLNKWSAYEDKTFPISPPKAPTGMTATLDDTFDNVTTFSWSIDKNDTNAFWWTDFEVQTKLFKESNVTKGADLDWSGATTTTQTGTSKEITEETELLAESSYTRWIRVRSRGIAGNSAWTYGKHVYAVPRQTNIIETSYKDNGANGYMCFVRWSAPSSASRPIKKMSVQYSITTPEAGMRCPSGASWTDAKYLRNTGVEDAAAFPIDTTIGLDQCLFVRINTQYDHDTNVTYGVPTLVTGAVGFLKDPIITDVEFHDVTFKADITAENKSEVEDSFLVVVYRPASNPESEQVVGIIRHGQTSVQVQAPDWSKEKSKAFGVYAAVGDSATISRASALMMSENIVFEGGEIPTAPDSVVASATDITGTVRVTWDWTWDDATGAELSWSDHADAWESTDEPDTYEISHIYYPQWNISGLETGIKWYVRVRLIAGTGDNKTYGPYSEITDMSTIDLTSAPSIPTLNVVPPVITESGSTIASWAYSTTDGTAQAYAEICEATITSNGIQYGSYFLSPDITVVTKDPEGHEVVNDKEYFTKSGDEYTKVDNVSISDNPHENGWYEYRRTIASVETEQRVTIPAQEWWETGNTYLLCVRVISASGRVSDEWSAPVPITVAEPLTVAISETSLVQKTQESGELISFTTSQSQDITNATVTIQPTQEGEGDPSPENIRPITGRSEIVLSVSDAEEGGTVTTYTETLPETIYDGYIDFVSGVLTVTSACIESYAGEELTTEWISDRDLYRDDVPPTEGAKVVYELEVPETYTLTANQLQTLAGENYMWSSDTMTVIYNDPSSEFGMLTEMPLTMTVSGMTEESQVSVAIERAEDYRLNRPDETTFRGYLYETIALKSPNRDGTIEFNAEDMIGALDDGARYRIVVTAKDSLGQTASATQNFEVHWEHQAIMPQGTAIPDEDEFITRITPIAPEGASQTDVCDIYRLSADKPELIVEGATFGVEYVDPYPTIGQFGGHRLVFRTANGDYITEDNQIAWLDLDASHDNILETDYTIIDFEGGRILLEYNIDLSNQWKKDFQATQYLGGSVQGDWNPAVERTASVNAEVITLVDQGTIKMMRRLATYAGICHIRTQDGSSFAADIQVSESSSHDMYGMRASFSLSITRVDQETLDGMTAKEYFATEG